MLYYVQKKQLERALKLLHPVQKKQLKWPAELKISAPKVWKKMVKKRSFAFFSIHNAELIITLIIVLIIHIWLWFVFFVMVRNKNLIEILRIIFYFHLSSCGGYIEDNFSIFTIRVKSAYSLSFPDPTYEIMLSLLLLLSLSCVHWKEEKIIMWYWQRKDKDN